MQATLIKAITDWKGDARLYKLDPPLREVDRDGEVVGEHEYVIVSGVDDMFSGPETYIFPASDDGEVTSWIELGGSFRGDIDHHQALENAGYTVQ